MPATDTFEALSPQQVNSWPIETPAETESGQTLAFFGSDSEEAFLLLAQERFRICKDASDPQRQESEIDGQFANGIQWDPKIVSQRNRQNRPCITTNRIDGFLAHAVNSFRQTRPEIKVIAAADGAVEEVAEAEEGLIRHIQINSAADVPYDESFKQMCTGGVSFLRVVDDWASPESMDQELFIRGFQNPWVVYYDPYCQQPDWSDGRFAFIVDDMTRAEFKKHYPNAKAVGLDNFSSIGNQQKDWFPDGKIRTAEYFHVEMKNDILCELEDKTTRLWSKLPQSLYFLKKNESGDLGLYIHKEGDDELDPAGEHVGRARKCKIPEVYWAKITAVDVLQERKWKGRYIPLIPVLGNQSEVDGHRVYAGMVRYARQPQQMYNYMCTCFVETVALAPRNAYIAEIGQIPDGAIRTMWDNYNDSPQVYLPYKGVVDETGRALPPPQRQSAELPIAALVQGIQMWDNNLKSIFRIYDASLGQRGPQESGLAIDARKVESDTGIYNWADNFNRSLRFLGVVLEDLLPAYYNTEGREFKLIQQDGNAKKVVMNQAPSAENKQQTQIDLEKGGSYRLVISTGPSAETKRKESLRGMIDFFKLIPGAAATCSDIIVEEADFPGKDKLAARLQKSLPPNLQDTGDDATPEVLQTQLGQATTQIQQLTEALKEATDKRLLNREKEEWETFRTQMREERQLASDAMKVGVAQSTYLSEKIFEELNLQRQMLQAQLNPPAPGQTPSQPPSSAPAAPAPGSAVPSTTVGNPPVGGV